MLPGVTPGRGPPPGRGAPEGPAPGRGPCGRGIGRSVGCCEENGLLPTRGVRGAGFGPPGTGPGRGPGVAPGVGPGRAGAGVGAEDAAGAGAAGAAGVRAAGGAGVRAAGAAGAAGVGGATGGAGGVGGVGLGADGLGPGRAAVAGPAAATLAAPAAPLPPDRTLSDEDFAPNVSRNRRATGASTVDEADLTNSPCSFSVARSSLLVTPSSLANSCTRALPATTSPV